MTRPFAISVEIVGISIASVAIALELIFKADIYLGVMTVGSLVFAAGSAFYAKIVKDG